MRAFLLATIEGIAMAATIGLVGCIARVDEERVYGPPRPLPGSRSEDLVEKRGTECRIVTVIAPAVREVEIRRRMVSESPLSPQATNAALFAMLVTGSALLAYDADQVACSRNAAGDCWIKATDSMKPAEYTAAALAAVPLALIAYNAVRARDTRSVETSPEGVDPGPWHTCSAEEDPGKAVERGDSDPSR
jgi:hypothetical protein